MGTNDNTRFKSNSIKVKQDQQPSSEEGEKNPLLPVCTINVFKLSCCSCNNKIPEK